MKEMCFKSDLPELRMLKHFDSVTASICSQLENTLNNLLRCFSALYQIVNVLILFHCILSYFAMHVNAHSCQERAFGTCECSASDNSAHPD